MSNKNSRTASPSSPPQQHVPTSKLPRFLQKSSVRDRSQSSVTDPTASEASSPPSSPSPEVQSTPNPGKTPRKGSKFLGLKDRGKDREDKKRLSDTPPPDAPNTTDMDESPVIVEPVAIPRPRTRSERPISSVPDAAIYASTPSSSRIGDLPTRLSGWFSHTFSTSSQDLSLPNILANHASPKAKSNALLTAAKHGRGHLGRTIEYIFDTDSTPDKCTDPIWLLGVQHPGYEPPPPVTTHTTGPPAPAATPPTSFPGRKNSGSPISFRSSTSSVASLASSSEQAGLSQSTSSNNPKRNPAANWPPVFYIDFTSRVWLTYRSQFPVPIKDGRLADLCGGAGGVASANASPAPTKRSPWHWVGIEKSWTSDSGWGCMLRTGQSLLANALVHVHLGREWRKPPYPVHTADYATYVHILTWFLDTPAPEAPFSVHRMALAGKELGTDVGQWFGPSVAAGAIKQLVNSYPDCGIGVAVAVDGVLYQTDVYAASHGDHFGRTGRRHKRSWGERQVLVLLGIRLGLEGVNPVYYETIKALYTFPQSVGIAGGRPGSSYYFVGAQADNLFYLDPHHARPAIPLRPAPPGPFPFPSAESQHPSHHQSHSHHRSHSDKHERDREKTKTKTSTSPSSHRRLPTSPSSTRTASSTFSYHAPLSPSPLQQQLSTSSNDTTSSTSTMSTRNESDAEIYFMPGAGTSSRSPPRPTPPPPPSSSHHGRWRSASQPASPGVSDLGLADLSSSLNSSSNHNDHGLDPVQEHYCTAYSAAELKTFHCERVRKMPLSGLDPSMLVGFLVRDQEDWGDLRRRIGELPRTIFSVQDEPPSWPSDSEDDMGLLSISEPDVDEDDDGEKVDDEDEDGVEVNDEDEEDDEEEEDEERYYDTRSASASVSSPSISSSASGRDHDRDRDRSYQPKRQRQSTTSEDMTDNPTSEEVDKRSKSEDNDTEEDPVDPLTPGPGPNSRFSIIDLESVKKAVDEDARAAAAAAARHRGSGVEFGSEEEEAAGTGDIEDDWVEPSLPTPREAQGKVSSSYPLPPPVASSSSTSSSDVKRPSSRIPSSSSKSKSSSNGAISKRRKGGKKQIPVPVPAVRIPSSRTPQQQHHQQQEHYPFPVTPAAGGQEDEEPFEELHSFESERSRNASTMRVKRMHNARARDGGRTQSGGVKGILAEDLS